MREYAVRYDAGFVNDLADSFDWGVRQWGSEAAVKWYNEIDASLPMLLSRFPEGFPTAPENVDLGVEMRQLVLGRYRILFVIKGDSVRVMHLRGPFSGSTE